MRQDAGPFLIGFAVLMLAGIIVLFSAGEPLGHCWLKSSVPCEVTFSSGVLLVSIGSGLIIAGIVSGVVFALLFLRANLPVR